LSLGDFCIVFLIGICIYHLSTFASEIASQQRYLIFASPKINGKTFVLTKFIRVFSDTILFFIVVFLSEMITNLARRRYKSEIILFIKNLLAQKTNKLIDINCSFVFYISFAIAAIYFLIIFNLTLLREFLPNVLYKITSIVEYILSAYVLLLIIGLLININQSFSAHIPRILREFINVALIVGLALLCLYGAIKLFDKKLEI